MQLTGAVIGTIAIFLPSALLVLFFYPIWHNLKRYAVIYRSLEGINAAVVGLMIASAFYLSKDMAIMQFDRVSEINLLVVAATFLLLRYTPLPTPVIPLICLFLGWVF